MKISPTLRPLLSDLLGDEASLISDELLLQVAEVMVEVRYLSTFLGDSYDAARVEQFESN